MKAFKITPSAIKAVFNAIESSPRASIIGVNNIVHGIATRTTNIPDRLSVAIVANIRIKARIDMTI